MLKFLRKFLFLAAFALVFAACLSSPGSNDGNNVFKLTILHTNDMHGWLQNVPMYATVIKQVRSEGGNVLLLDAGDLYRRGKYERFNGAVETEIFNAMGYDAITLGNNDFLLSGKELTDVSKHPIFETANFSVVCANITVDGNYIKGIEPYIIKEIEGVKIVIIGVTTTSPRTRGMNISKHVLFEEPVPVLNKLILETKDKSDIQIALSHAGFETDLTMRNVSAVVGGHSHTKLIVPHVIRDGQKRIPVVQTGGESDHSLGRLDLVFIKNRGQWVLNEFSGYLFWLNDIEPDIEIQAILDKYNRRL